MGNLTSPKFKCSICGSTDFYFDLEVKDESKLSNPRLLVICSGCDEESVVYGKWSDNLTVKVKNKSRIRTLFKNLESLPVTLERYLK
jgi:hypothetical protein